MKSGRVFWGTLFVIIGVLGLLNNFFSINIAWGTLWKLWPLLLVFLGLSVFLKDSKVKWVAVGAIGLLTGLVLFSSVQHGCDSVDTLVERGFDGDDSSVTITQTLTESYDSASGRAYFSLEGGAGNYSIGDTTSDYVRADVRSSISGYMLTRETFDGIDRFHVEMTESSVHWKGKARNRVRVALHPEPLWDIDIDAGAATLDLDLTPYRVRDLSLEAGAASIDVRLGARSDTTNVTIEAGASSVKLHVPEEVGCEIVTESALSSKDFPGFVKMRGGQYRTGNFDTAKRKMYISVETGLSSISVRRYAAGDTW
ncbi:MAG TPA: DUF5668 domain-containing protein [Bacteroidota bacterium]|nr:DUF5668 domain-containing protein [Bacteroidota bacterium]